MKLAGGKYADIAVTEAVTDGHLVTAPAWSAHPAWMAQFVKALGCNYHTISHSLWPSVHHNFNEAQKAIK